MLSWAPDDGDLTYCCLFSVVPWIEKAKVVWSVWRRKVKPEEKKVYLKKARDNRAKVCVCTGVCVRVYWCVYACVLVCVCVCV